MGYKSRSFYSLGGNECLIGCKCRQCRLKREEEEKSKESNTNKKENHGIKSK